MTGHSRFTKTRLKPDLVDRYFLTKTPSRVGLEQASNFHTSDIVIL